ncbi:MAG: hypothetical protein LBQ49_00765, partial [Rickettsiales bacterium]|nr:hypothetical protein [Rickettsiales bacterium]
MKKLAFFILHCAIALAPLAPAFADCKSPRDLVLGCPEGQYWFADAEGNNCGLCRTKSEAVKECNGSNKGGYYFKGGGSSNPARRDPWPNAQGQYSITNTNYDYRGFRLEWITCLASLCAEEWGVKKPGHDYNVAKKLNINDRNGGISGNHRQIVDVCAAAYDDYKREYDKNKKPETAPNPAQQAKKVTFKLNGGTINDNYLNLSGCQRSGADVLCACGETGPGVFGAQIPRGITPPVGRPFKEWTVNGVSWNDHNSKYFSTSTAGATGVLCLSDVKTVEAVWEPAAKPPVQRNAVFRNLGSADAPAGLESKGCSSISKNFTVNGKSVGGIEITCKCDNNNGANVPGVLKDKRTR